MARPVEFDRDAARDVAMKLFWSQGYSATPLAQLLEGMDIGRSSFYAAFGDKRSLFVEVLELFALRTREILTQARRPEDALGTVRRFFEHTLLQVPRSRARRGCLMVNTILELADVDAELSAHAASELDRIEAEFQDCFKEAQGAGRYPPHRSAEALASHVMLLNQGLRVSSRKRVSRAKLQSEIDLALSLLEPATTSVAPG